MHDLHHIYLIPGLFGFSNLAGYDYFGHVRQALEQRYAESSIRVHVEVVGTPPTSSIPERARMLARAVHRSSDHRGPIHLLGHSTGGIDMRLVLSPSHHLQLDPSMLTWTRRVKTAVSVNSPHYGTPLATYFTTAAGTRMLYALSLLTIISLALGESSLAVFSRVLGGLGSVDQVFGGDLKLISRGTDLLLRFVNREGRLAIRTYLNQMRIDQGAIIQTTPEAMDLFNAMIVDASHVNYGCVVTGVAPPNALRMGRRVRSTYQAFSAALFSTIYRVTAQRHERYGYARLGSEELSRISRELGFQVTEESSDGVVPTLSMVWDRPLWCSPGDHLDVLGHFSDDHKPARHADWMNSGARFSRAQFADLMKTIVKFQLGEETSRASWPIPKPPAGTML